VAECLPSKHEAISSSPSSDKKFKYKKKKEKKVGIHELRWNRVWQSRKETSAGQWRCSFWLEEFKLGDIFVCPSQDEMFQIGEHSVGHPSGWSLPTTSVFPVEIKKNGPGPGAVGS
jgi:hypothetical protein